MAYYERGEREYYNDEQRYLRDRRERDLHIENERHLETERRMETERRIESERRWDAERIERQRADRERERDRLLQHGGGERDVWRDPYDPAYAATTPTRGAYVGRGRAMPDRMVYRDYDREREDMERSERDRMDRMERDRMDMERDRFEREKWARR